MVSNRLKMSLLPALQALLDTVSVTRAAAAMHVTQSTMSRTLGQLRGILNDPILVREGNHIYLSAKAQKIQPQVNRLVTEANTLFESQVFDPATCQQSFNLAANSIFQQDFLVEALVEIKEQAPNITFSIKPSSHITLQELETGELDLGLIQFSDEGPKWLQKCSIIEEALHIVVRRDHPLTKTGITVLSDLDDFPCVEVEAPIHVASLGENLKARSASLRTPWLSMQSWEAAFKVLKHSDSFLTSNSLGCPQLLTDPDYEMLPVPEDIPSTTLRLVWPEYWEFSQAHQWLRNQLEQKLRDHYQKYGKGNQLVSANA